MIKVCHIVNLVTGKSDGVFNHLRMIFRNYDHSGFEHFVIFQGGVIVEKRLSELKIKYYIVESLQQKYSIKSFNEIYQIIKKENPDILHTHLIKPYIIVGLVNVITRKKIIFNYHGIFLANNPYYGFWEKLIYKMLHIIIFVFGKIDVVLVPSQKSKKMLIQETKLFPDPIVYYNGFDHSTVSSSDPFIINELKNLRKKGKIIAVIARLEIQKRIDRALILIKAILEKDKNVFLLIFGDGSLKQLMIEKTKNLKIDSRVIFYDYIENIVSSYQYFDLLLFTSDWEGMPLSIWESMANGVPVVAPEVGGFAEILIENNCGLIYEPANLKEAEEKVLILLGDEMKRKKLGENGKKAIESIYNERNFIKQIEEIYTNL